MLSAKPDSFPVISNFPFGICAKEDVKIADVNSNKESILFMSVIFRVSMLTPNVKGLTAVTHSCAHK